MTRVVFHIEESILPTLEEYKTKLQSSFVGTPLRSGGFIVLTVDTNNPEPLIKKLVIDPKVKHLIYTVLQ